MPKFFSVGPTGRVLIHLTHFLFQLEYLDFEINKKDLYAGRTYAQIFPVTRFPPRYEAA